MESIKVSQAVYDGLESVRKGGKTNMLDVDMVIILSAMSGYMVTSNWITDNKSEYCKGIFRGFEVKDA